MKVLSVTVTLHL